MLPVSQPLLTRVEAMIHVTYKTLSESDLWWSYFLAILL